MVMKILCWCVVSATVFAWGMLFSVAGGTFDRHGFTPNLFGLLIAFLGCTALSFFACGAIAALF